jgi:hypothetical protein
LTLEPQAIADGGRADMDELSALHRLPKPHDWKTLRRQKDVGLEQQRKQRHLAWRFGELTGWRLSDRQFSLWALAHRKVHAGGSRDFEKQYLQGNTATLDHADFFRLEGRAAAIAAHLYSRGME